MDDVDTIMASLPPSSPRPLPCALAVVKPLLPPVLDVEMLDPELRDASEHDFQQQEPTRVKIPSEEQPEIDDQIVLERLRRPSRAARSEGLTSRRVTRSRSRREEVKIKPMPSIHERRKLSPVLPDHNGRFRADAMVQLVVAENLILEIEVAFRLFEAEAWASCQHLCLQIVELEPSEAVMAKAHMLLGAMPVETTSLDLKLFHIEQSLQQWSKVIARTGRSRYPIDKARVELAAVQTLLTRLRVEVSQHAPRST